MLPAYAVTSSAAACRRCLAPQQAMTATAADDPHTRLMQKTIGLGVVTFRWGAFRVQVQMYGSSTRGACCLRLVGNARGIERWWWGVGAR